MWNRKSHLRQGKAAENKALEFLKRNGLRLIARNYRSRRGEIDLVMEDGDDIVFVEVRYRANSTFGSALESVDRNKQARLIACALQYLSENHLDKASRFDVIGLSPGANGTRIDWVRNAFETA